MANPNKPNHIFFPLEGEGSLLAPSYVSTPFPAVRIPAPLYGSFPRGGLCCSVAFASVGRPSALRSPLKAHGWPGGAASPPHPPPPRRGVPPRAPNRLSPPRGDARPLIPSESFSKHSPPLDPHSSPIGRKGARPVSDNATLCCGSAADITGHYRTRALMVRCRGHRTD